MLRSIEGVNITRNNSCYSFLKEEIFQFYKAIGYGYSSEKDVLSWICFLTWQKCTWSWWSGWKQEFPCRQLAWPFFRVIFSGFHEDCFRNCAYKKKFKPNCLFELEMICKVISNCWFYNYREEIRPFYKSYSFRLRYTRFDSGH